MLDAGHGSAFSRSVGRRLAAETRCCNVYPLQEDLTMQVAKWGNSLAVRLPAELVRQLGLKEGDHIDIADTTRLVVARHQRPDETLASLRQFRGRLPAGARMNRDDAHER